MGNGGPGGPAAGGGAAGRTIVVGTRGSPLAVSQTEEVIGRLRREFPSWQFTRKEIVTRGDVVLSRTLPELGGRGVFVKELEVALLEGAIDAAVHSLKDMPVEPPEGLEVAAVTGRGDPRDVLVVASRHREAGLSLATLPQGARIGTGSLRRAAQLRAFRGDFRVEPIRGNLQTRLRKLEEEGFDAIVLAAAGLERLGLEGLIAERIPLDIALPAPGQGALALQARAADRDLLEAFRRVEDPGARAATDGERAVLAALGGGCYVPIGAFGRVEGGRLHLEACVIAPDGRSTVRGAIDGPMDQAVALGQQLGQRLLGEGADRLLAELGRIFPFGGE